MKKVLLLIVTVVGFNVSANAAFVQCNNNPNNPGAPGNWSIAQLQIAGCEAGDKVFSNFSNTAPTTLGGIPSDTLIQFSIGNQNDYTINFINTAGNGFATGFTESFDVTIDFALAAGPTTIISQVNGGMQDNHGGGTALLTKTVTALVGTLNGNPGVLTVGDNNGTITPTIISGIAATSLHIVDVYSQSAGVNVSSVSNTVTQTTPDPPTSTPEPVSMLLFGTGLLVVSMVGRNRFTHN